MSKSPLPDRVAAFQADLVKQAPDADSAFAAARWLHERTSPRARLGVVLGSTIAVLVLAVPAVRAEPPTARIHGFVELDALWDSTQSFADFAGNAPIARPGTPAGEHGQVTFGARNSRVGVAIAATPRDDLAVTGELEMDFLGNQPPGVAESAFFQSPTLRLRHAYVKLATPGVDLLIGQSWQLFGWQSAFFPNTVEIQGVPGEVFARAPQLRVGKTLRAGDITVRIAVAAARPPERASSTPDVQAGLQVDLDALRALHTAGSATTSLDAASIGVSVVGRRFALDEPTGDASTRLVDYGRGLSLDALIPIVPATREHPENAVTLTGSFVTGAGVADLYTGLTGGVPAPARVTHVDAGLVASGPDGALHPVQWTSYIVGVQYYLPPHAKAWLSASLAHLRSDNARALGDPTTIFDRATWADCNVFIDPAPGVRLGVELARFAQTFVDGVEATNFRAELSVWLIF